MKCMIDNTEYDTDSKEFRTLVEEHIEETYTQDEYEELLNEAFEEVHIGELCFNPGEIIRELDPTAFRIGMMDEIDNKIEEIIYNPEEFIKEVDGEIIEVE